MCGYIEIDLSRLKRIKMSREKIEQLIRNAVFRKTRKESDWFDNVKKIIVTARSNKEVVFSNFIQDLITDCQKHHATSVEEAVKEMVEQLNTDDEEHG